MLLVRVSTAHRHIKLNDSVKMNIRVDTPFRKVNQQRKDKVCKHPRDKRKEQPNRWAA